MAGPDIRGRIIEAVLTRAAAAGVDDVALVCANGLNRRLTPAELAGLVGERVFRSFFADGLLTNHDAEDLEAHTEVGADRGRGGQPEHAGGPVRPAGVRPRRGVAGRRRSGRGRRSG